MPKKSSPVVQTRNRLVEARFSHGWSQQEVAALVGTTALNVSRWERGLTTPTAYFREKLSALFAVSATELGLLSDASRHETPSLPTTLSLLPEVVYYDEMIPVLVEGTPLIGRDEIIAQLKAHLFSAQRLALSALGGLPGVGKTTLATHLAYDAAVRAHFTGGILWASLGPTPSVQSILSRWGIALGMSESVIANLTSLSAWAMQLRSAIGTRRFLIIIDDVWQLEDALSCQIGGPQCAYLLTTRFPQIALAFAGTEVHTIGELSIEESIALLTLFAPLAVEREPDLVQELSLAVGGLPLALTLIGNYLRLQSHDGQPRRIRNALVQLRDTRERLRLVQLRSPLEQEASRKQAISLQAIIEMSDLRLSKDARQALRAFAVFPAKPTSFSEEMALAVCGADIEVLDELCDAGLMESAGAGRYRLHQTIVDYARLHQHEHDAVERFVTYCVTYMEAHQQDYTLLEEESVLLLSSLEQALARGLREEWLRGVVALSPFLVSRGFFEVAGSMLTRADEVAEELHDTRKHAQVLYWLVERSIIRSTNSQIEAYARKGLNLAQTLKDEKLECVFLANLAWIMMLRGSYDEAERHILAGLEITRPHGFLDQEISLLRTRGVLAYHRGDYAQAKMYYQQALPLARRVGNTDAVCRLLNNMGLTWKHGGDYEQAEHYYQQALHLARQLKDTPKMENILINYGSLEYMLSHYEKAEAFIQEGVALARKAGDKDSLCAFLGNLGAVLIAKKNFVDARSALEEAVVISRQVGNTGQLMITNVNLADVLDVQGEHEMALAHLQEALQAVRRSGSPAQLAETLWLLGRHYILCHDVVYARDAFQEMYQVLPEGDQKLQGDKLYSMALMAAEQGDIPEAHRLAQEAFAILRIVHRAEADELEAWLQTLPESGN